MVAEGGDQGPPAVVAALPVDPDLDERVLTERIGRAERAVDALRFRIESTDTGVINLATDPGRLGITEIRRFELEKQLQADLNRAAAETTFDRTAGPLCSVVVYDLDGPSVPRRRWLVWFFDHLIADMISVDLFKAAWAADEDFQDLSGYGDWLRDQNTAYQNTSGPDGDFWREHLGTVAPRVCDDLHFRRATNDHSPDLRVVGRRLPVDDRIRAVCATQMLTTFALVAGAHVLALSDATGRTKMTVAVSSHGRDDTTSTLFGNLANMLVVRVDVDPDDRELGTLENVQDALLDTATHAPSPLPFVHEAVGADPDVLTSSTVTLNHIPHFSVTEEEFVDLDGSEPRGKESGLWVDVVSWHEGDGVYLLVKFDPTRFDAAGVERFLDQVAEYWEVFAILAGG